uniref:Uncharacterized protein n=1 Tax=Octopus bimaculoides TaxID=37653 RepID=A0A0L8FQI5_OCTBM
MYQPFVSFFVLCFYLSSVLSGVCCRTSLLPLLYPSIPVLLLFLLRLNPLFLLLSMSLTSLYHLYCCLVNVYKCLLAFLSNVEVILPTSLYFHLFTILPSLLYFLSLSLSCHSSIRMHIHFQSHYPSNLHI